MSTKVKQDKIRAEIREIKEKNKSHTPDTQIHYKFAGDKLLVNNVVVRPAVVKPSVSELLFPENMMPELQSGSRLPRLSRIVEVNSWRTLPMWKTSMKYVVPTIEWFRTMQVLITLCVHTEFCKETKFCMDPLTTVNLGQALRSKL